MHKTAKWLKDRLVGISSRSLFGSIIFAMALWCYTSLNETYNTVVQVPLNLNMPKTRAIENAIPVEVNVQVKGNGWHLFNLLFFNNNKVCNVNLDASEVKEENYTIPRSQLIKSLENFSNVETKEISPEIIPIKTGIVKETTVDIIPNVTVKPAKDFVLVGEIQVKPEKMKIWGNENLIKNLTQVFTQKINLENINKQTTVKVGIADSIRNKFKLPITQVELTVNVQKLAEITIHDIPIKFEPANYQTQDILQPRYISVTLRGGINQIENINQESIVALIDYKSIINDETGLLQPRIICPRNLEVINVSPKFIYHYKTQKLP